MILLDTSGLFSVIDEAQPHHTACADRIARAHGPFLLSPFVLAELDYLLGRRVGSHAQMGLLDEVARGAYRLEPFGPSDVAQAREVMARYADLPLGLTDASILVLADRHGVRDVLTLDERHFRALRGRDRRRLRLLPAEG